MVSGRGFAFCLAAVLSCQTAAQAQVVIPETTLARHGLTRGWRAQVELNRATDRVAYITQFDGVLYVQTNHALIHALDAETGKKLWSTQVGQLSQVSLAPGVSKNYLAVINGSTLHVLDRASGRERFTRVLGGAPGTGPTVSDTMVFVCMINGLIEGYQLEDQHALPWVHRAAGRILTQPVISDASLAWTTDKGYFYVADVEPPKVRFRVETQAEISSRPAHWTPYLYACSQSGFLYAVNEDTGLTSWKFPAGSSLSTQPVAVNGLVYISRDSGGLLAIDGRTGDQRWYAPRITQFCSVSATHVYAMDELNRLVILVGERGNRLSSLQLGDVQFKLINQQTDRIYLATDTGIVQCIHELGQQTPLVYTPPPTKRLLDKPDDRKSAAAGTEGAEKKGAAGADDENSADAMGDAPSEEGDMPEEEEKDSADSDDPFGK